MKLTALLVLLAIPSSSWAQATRSASLQLDAPLALDAPVATTLEPTADADPFLLKLATPTTQRWYFWAGIALSIVTTAATALGASYLIALSLVRRVSLNEATCRETCGR